MIGVALYGCGTVGSAVAEALATRADGFELRHVVVRDPHRLRTAAVPRALLRTDWRAPLADPGVQVVIEVMGGAEPAGSLIRGALRTGRQVVTANKALIAAAGAELEALAWARGAFLGYEAAVAGAIPVLDALRGPLAANRIRRVAGILNGTTNYILTRMEEDLLDLPAALRQAQELGFAEADPGADLSGRDAAQKLVILARHAFGRWLPLERVRCEGIEAVTGGDIDDALRAGERIRLVAEASLGDDDEVVLEVAPRALPAVHPLAAVRNETNAVAVEGDLCGVVVLAGPGAGGKATASAVYGDLLRAAGSRGRPLAPLRTRHPSPLSTGTDMLPSPIVISS
jgi:homoserine dehydrogenase